MVADVAIVVGDMDGDKENNCFAREAVGLPEPVNVALIEVEPKDWQDDDVAVGADSSDSHAVL